MKQIITRIDDDLHKNLKIITAQNETTVQKIIENFLKDYVEKYLTKRKE